MSRINFICKINNSCQCANFIVKKNNIIDMFKSSSNVCSNQCYYDSLSESENLLKDERSKYQNTLKQTNNSNVTVFKNNIMFDNQVPLL